MESVAGAVGEGIECEVARALEGAVEGSVEGSVEEG